MLHWIKNLRYLFGEQCDDYLGEDRCHRRKNHQGWHTKNGSMYWGDKYYGPTQEVARE